MNKRRLATNRHSEAAGVMQQSYMFAVRTASGITWVYTPTTKLDKVDNRPATLDKMGLPETKLHKVGIHPYQI